MCMSLLQLKKCAHYTGLPRLEAKYHVYELAATKEMCTLHRIALIGGQVPCEWALLQLKKCAQDCPDWRPKMQPC
jgi:hypothetical protein